MFRYFLRKAALIPFILLLANFIGYTFAFYTSPIVAGSNPYSSAETNLPPLLLVYRDYLVQISQGNFGETFSQEPVADAILRFGSASLGLLAIATILSVIFGVSLGRASVRRNKGGIAPWLTIFSTLGLALPGFYVATLLIGASVLIAIYATDSVELIIPFQGFGWDAHLILPTMALLIQPTVKIARVTGGLLSEEMEKQYVSAAMSFGHSFKAIKARFAFRGILAPILMTIAASLRIMIAELIIIERLFNWPGLGRLTSLTLSLRGQSGDLLAPPMIAALLTVFVAAFLLIDFIATLLSRIADPRLRADVEKNFAAKG